MLDGKMTIEKQFKDWLASKVSPVQQSELCRCLSIIEHYCLRLKILRKPLFETTDVITIKKVQQAISESKLFQFTHKKQMKKMVLAAQLYAAFAKELETAASNKANDNTPEEETQSASAGDETILIITNEPLSSSENVEALKSVLVEESLLKKALQEECALNKYGTTATYLCSVICKPSVKESDVKRILNEEPWAKLEHGRYHYIEPIVEEESETHESLFVAFNNIVDLSYTKPVHVRYFDEVIETARSWSDVYVKLVAALYDDYPTVIPIGRPFSGTGRIDFGNKEAANSMIAPKRVYMEMYLETNLSATGIAEKLKALLNICNVDYENVVIEYEVSGRALRTVSKASSAEQNVLKNAKAIPKKDSRAPVNTTPDVVKSAQKVWSSANLERYKGILAAHFANGYRLKSPIEMFRFRSFAKEDFGEDINISDEDLRACLEACGTVHDDKVYVVSAEAEKRIREEAESYFSSGARAIFFSEFYSKNESWLFDASVISENMLTEILHKLFPALSFTSVYFGYSDASIFTVLEDEILRVWGDDVLLTYNRLAERLPYIPLNRIKQALGQNGDFIWNSVETFSHISRIEIFDSERDTIREVAVRECNTQGYVSITDLPFDEMEERNFELSITAIHTAIFRICLLDKFDKKGKIITRKGDVFDALTITKDYCRSIDKCSLDDLLNFEKELTGEVHRWISMEAGYAILVRIDKDTFVADRYVHFDSDAIDDVIGLFVTGDYLPLRAFTTFGAFPDCGQTWNLFLLESYCRRFSKEFRFEAPSVNSRNAGTVIRRSCGKEYTEIMTDAIVKAGVPLRDDVIGRFLHDSGYTGRSTTSKINEIKIKAKAMQERDN